MTVKELIEKLQELDPETRVMTQGYAGGYCDVSVSEVCNVALDVNTPRYYGPHDRLDKDDEYPNSQIVKAIIL